MGKRRSRPESPPVEPFDVDGVRTVAVGTAAWVLAFLALLPFRSRLAESGHGLWLWTCLAGAGLGLLGLEVVRRRRERILRARHGGVPEAPLPADPPLAMGPDADGTRPEEEPGRDHGA